MSKKKKTSPLFHVGKGISKNDDSRTPMKGEANSNLDTYRKADGKLHSRRKFGKDGNAEKDLDVASGHKSYDHAHDIEYNSKKKNPRKEERGLTKQEARELNKAKKKRRFWKDD